MKLERKKGITEEYFVEIVEKEKDLLFRLSYNILQNVTDSEDAVSDAILKAWEKKDSLKNPDKLRSWLIRITINVSKNMLPLRNRLKLVEDIKEYGEEKVENSNQDMWDFVRKLNEKERIVVILFYYRGFSVTEIAKILSVPAGTVKSRLFHARENLKKLYCNVEGLEMQCIQH